MEKIQAQAADGLSQFLKCPVCEGALLLVPDTFPLLFNCEAGHYHTALDLLFGEGAAAARAVSAQQWKDRMHALIRVAQEALRNGHTFFAADVLDLVQRIKNRPVPVNSVAAAED